MKFSLVSKSNLLKTMVTLIYDFKCVISVESVKNRTIFVFTVIIEDDCIKATFCMKCIHMNVIELILVIKCSKYTLEYNEGVIKILDILQISTCAYIYT